MNRNKIKEAEEESFRLFCEQTGCMISTTDKNELASGSKMVKRQIIRKIRKLLKGSNQNNLWLSIL